MLELVALRLMRRSPAPYLFGNRCDCSVCRWGVYRQRKNGEASRMESTGGRLPCQNEGCRAEKRWRRESPAGADRRTDPFGFCGNRQRRQSSPPQHFTEDTLLSAMETAGKEDMPEDAERKGLGTPATRAGILESWYLPVFWNEKEQENGAASPSHDAVSLSQSCRNSCNLRF